MTRLAKLNARFLAGGALGFAEFERLLEAYGFRHLRTSGSHHIYARDGVADQLSVQPQGKHAKPYQMRQFRTIILQHALRLDDPL